MRKLILLLLAIILSVSCTTEYENITPENNTTQSRPERVCMIGLENSGPNEIIEVDCALDLNGQTIILDQNVWLHYDGGSLLNGTIVFNGGLIDGRLLNSTLTISGSARLVSTDFIYEKDNWDITEGVVTDAVALANRESLNETIALVKSLRGNVFEINGLDAYFDVRAGYGGSKIENYRRSIQLPSNFHLKMDNNTHLRVQPNDKRDYALLCAFSEINVTISGGHVWGDRYTHDYLGGDTGIQDLGYGIYFIGVENGIVDNTSANEFTGDGFIISSVVKRNDDGSPDNSTHYGTVYWSRNLTIINCVFDDNRRNGLALTDVEIALLHNNVYSNNGNGIYNSLTNPSGGVVPKHGIDLEAIQSFQPDGITLNLTEIISDVIISDSDFLNNYGDIDYYKCWDVEVFGNYFESGSGNVASYNISIHDNVFLANGPRSRAINIKPAIRNDGSHYTKGWEVYNNTITGYNTGIQVGGQDQLIYNNTVSDFNNGIFLLNGLDNTLTNNVLSSNRSSSRGFYNFPAGVSIENTLILGGSVSVASYPLLSKKINENGATTSGLTFDGVTFYSSNGTNVELRDSQYVTIKNSTYHGATQVNSSNITLTNNTTW